MRSFGNLVIPARNVSVTSDKNNIAHHILKFTSYREIFYRFQ